MIDDSWQGWQYFLAIANCGSLNKAAVHLGVSQPTLSRQLLAMEKSLGQSLFDRSTKGLQLTVFAQGLLEECAQMQASAERLQRLASGQEKSLSGRVRLAVNELMALHYLPQILPRFMALYPEISVEVVVSNRATNLDKRDADIAVRMFEPTQLDLVYRRLTDIPLGFYASKGYLKSYGTPTNAEMLFQHRVIGYDQDNVFELGAQQMGFDITNSMFKLRSDFMPMHLELAKHDGGIVASHAMLCDKLGLVKINAGIELPALPVYLVCHRDVQHNKRMRALMDFLAEHLAACLTANSNINVNN